MNILFCSVPFSPSVGGIETVSTILREQFASAGHRVVLVTRTPVAGGAVEDAGIVRRPNPHRLFGLVRSADVVFHNNISLRFAWPLIFVRRPWVIAHHIWIGRSGLLPRIKRMVLRYASHIAVSRAIADDLPQPCAVVPNPYDDKRFNTACGVVRARELLFVGRLVSDKGVSLLLEALALLRQRGRTIHLTIVGEGPEELALRWQAVALEIDGQVEFAGRRVGAALVEALNLHQVLVVPSVWQEPFGVVALEAMACGCVPLVARSGGLPEAVGAAGLVVERGSVAELAQGISELVGNERVLQSYRAQAALQLERHSRDRITRDYLRIIDLAYRTHAAQRTARAV